MTYGDAKLRLTQMFPSVSLDLVEGFLNDRYTEILGELPWSRQNVESILVTTAAYTAGTVAVTQGSNAVTLTGGTWTSGMVGMCFRVTGLHAYYAFQFATATTGTIDRPYEGASESAAAYSLSESVYALPTDCRLLEENAFDGLKRFSRAELNEVDPHRVATGKPVAWCSYMDDSSIPPFMQVELWPTPQLAIGKPYTYASDAGSLSATSAIVQAWMQPTALLEGAIAKIKAHLKDYTGAQLAMVAAKAALQVMRMAEAQGMPPTEMKLDSFYTRHRMKR